MVQMGEVDHESVAESGVREETGIEISTISLTMFEKLAADLLAVRKIGQ